MLENDRPLGAMWTGNRVSNTGTGYLSEDIQTVAVACNQDVMDMGPATVQIICPRFILNSLVPAYEMSLLSLINDFQTNSEDSILEHFPWNGPQVNAIRSHWLLVNIV